MLTKYVANWPSVVLVYLNLKTGTIAKFKDGYSIEIAKKRVSQFYEHLYVKYLEDHGFKFESAGEYRKAVTPTGLQLFIREELYAYVLDEVFVTQVYGSGITLCDRPVIDVGATIGDSALYFCSRGARVVYGFEPDPNHYEVAIKNISANGLRNKIFLYNEKAVASRINKLMDEKNLDDVFIKIDCEGCEYDLVSQLDLEKITDIVIEYHGKPEPLVDRIRAVGFKIEKNKETIKAYRGR